MKKLTFTFLFLSFSFFGFSQIKFTEDIFNGMMQRYQKDMSKFLKTETTSDFIFVGADGKSMSRKDFMAFGETSDGFLKNDFSDIKIRQYGSTAIVTGVWSHSHRAKNTGNVASYTESVTEVFVFQKGKWIYVSHQSTPLPGSKE